MKDHGRIHADANAERLSEMVEVLAAQVAQLSEKIGVAPTSTPSALIAPQREVVAPTLPIQRKLKPPLPLPRLLRRIIRNRQLRARFLDNKLFADPAWDMLLDLAAARGEDRRVSVTSLCIASGVPPTTALRWISQMVEQGLFVRVGDQADRRRAFIDLSDNCADAVARYFAETGSDAYR